MERQQSGGLVIAAEATLLNARSTAEGLGLQDEAGSMPILIAALAMAIADAAGPHADQPRLERGLNLACDQLAEMLGPIFTIRRRQTQAN